MSEKANTIGGQATEKGFLLRLPPVIIGNKVDPLDLAWQLVMTLKKVAELVCTPTITTVQVAYLNIVVVEYLETRKAVFFSDHLKPKHHFLVCYA
ncbi:hypothetical protein DVA81_18290 [Acinetobacter baumannii]|nr:hypothetical protein DVA81_18290 [Acinetobacter baumannii]